MRENKHYFNQKKAGEALLLSDKTDFLGWNLIYKIESVWCDKTYFIKYVTVLNLCIPNNINSKQTKQNW
jgi:hypothetical protein